MSFVNQEICHHCVCFIRDPETGTALDEARLREYVPPQMPTDYNVKKQRGSHESSRRVLLHVWPR